MTDLANKLEVRAQTGNVGQTVYDLLEKQRGAIQKALPNVGITAERLVRVLQTQMRVNPKLADCTPASLLGAVMFTAQLGLEPGPLGHAYIIPYMNNKTNKLEAQFQLGYRGMIALAFRSSNIVISAYEIHKNDIFDFDLGTDAVKHTFYFDQDRGPIIGFWAKAVLPNGVQKIHVMTKTEVDAHRAKSKAKDGDAWTQSYGPMGSKTVIRVLTNQLPLSSDVQQALVADETSVVFNEDEGFIATGDAPVVIDVEAEEEGKLV